MLSQIGQQASLFPTNGIAPTKTGQRCDRSSGTKDHTHTTYNNVCGVAQACMCAPEANETEDGTHTRLR